MPTEKTAQPSERTSAGDARVLAATGIEGLDFVLGGGLPLNRLYLLDGSPGTGKTTLALQFLLEGIAHDERGLYVTLSETREELIEVATSHGWSLDELDVFEMTREEVEGTKEGYTLFHPAEVELQETIDTMFAAVEKSGARRIVLDSLSEMRLLARDPLRFRRQILALKHFFSGRNCTVLLLDDKTAPAGDLQLHSLAHGVIQLEQIALEYGSERRRLQVLKLRGRSYRGGYHDFRIRTGGLAVYPRLPRATPRPLDGSVLVSGSIGIDELLGGGLPKASSLLITGPAGTGKSVLSTQYACSAADRGEKARIYLFDERVSTFMQRAHGLDMDLRDVLNDGRLTLCQIEPTELSPGEFARHVTDGVREGVTVFVIDSINGYLQSMPEERLLPIQVHELLTYLSSHGCTTVLTLVQRGIFGSPVDEAADVSYLADSVILLRYFEVNGAVRQAISVVKKRSGDHERTIREFRVAKGGLRVGDPLTEFQGVLTGVPQYIGDTGPLMHRSIGAVRAPSVPDGKHER